MVTPWEFLMLGAQRGQYYDTCETGMLQMVSERGHESMCSTGTSNSIMGGEGGLHLIPHRLGRRTKHFLIRGVDTFLVAPCFKVVRVADPIRTLQLSVTGESNPGMDDPLGSFMLGA